MSRKIFGFAFVAATLIFVLVVYNRLPAQVATHFNVRGEPDEWNSRAFAAFFIPVFATLLIGVFNLLPRILPRREHFSAFADSYWLVANLVIAFLCARTSSCWGGRWAGRLRFQLLRCSASARCSWYWATFCRARARTGSWALERPGRSRASPSGAQPTHLQVELSLQAG
jgi:hypothetical protein